MLLGCMSFWPCVCAVPIDGDGLRTWTKTTLEHRSTISCNYQHAPDTPGAFSSSIHALVLTVPEQRFSVSGAVGQFVKLPKPRCTMSFQGSVCASILEKVLRLPLLFVPRHVELCGA